jgi:hypothetical protein
MEIGSRISRVVIFRHWPMFRMLVRVCLIFFFFLLSSCFLSFKLQHLFNWRLRSIIFIYLFYIIFHWFWKWLWLSWFFLFIVPCWIYFDNFFKIDLFFILSFNIRFIGNCFFSGVFQYCNSWFSSMFFLLFIVVPSLRSYVWRVSLS